VTRDVPPGTTAMGNPARVSRITLTSRSSGTHS
jgi:acetyltransferase-like isoleucine patch superfamily enzyme